MAEPQRLDYRAPRSPRPRSAGFVRHVVAWSMLALGVALICYALAPPGHICELLPRPLCAANEHQIGLAILLYQQDHAGCYPPALADLVADEQIGPEVFVCTGSNDTRAALPSNPTTRQVVAAWAAPGHVSYLYFGHADWTDKTVKDDAIVLAEPPSNHTGNGSNVLFGDGHADWIPMPRAARLIAAAGATTRPVSAATVP